MFKASSACIVTLSLLIGCRLSFAAPRYILAQQESAGQALTAKTPPLPHAVEGQVTISNATQDMTVAQPNKVVLDLHGKVASRIVAEWSYYRTPDFLESPFASGIPLGLQHGDDGSTYVNVIPQKLGHFKLGLQIDFEDGGIESDSVDVNVNGLPNTNPQRLILIARVGGRNEHTKAGTRHLDLSPGSNKEVLAPAAFYNGMNTPVQIGASNVVYTIATKKNQPSPIALDPSTGQVTAVRTGQALVKVTFRGMSAYACIDVMKNVMEASERSNCQDFLPAGMTEPIDEPLHLPNVR